VGDRIGTEVKFGIYLAILFFSLQLCALQAHAAPVETGHWNSNTFGNLNALADFTDITFTAAYNESGTIAWYKDGVLVASFADTTSAQYTTSWAAKGMQEVKARMTNGNGTSAETVWPVEVQEIGDATLEHATKYPELRIRGYWTINVRNGWTNFPGLYLKTKKTDWLEYVEYGTYIIKAYIDIRENGNLKVDDGSAKCLKMRALPTTDNMPTILRASVGGIITLDNLKVVGWDVDQNTETANNVRSPMLWSSDASTLKITNSECRHIAIMYYGDTSAGDLVDHNTFYYAKPNVLDLTGSMYQVITNNYLYNGDHLNEGEANMTGGGYLTVKYNKFIGPATCADTDNTAFGGNVSFGAGCTVIGNEIMHAGWNLAEVHKDVFCRDNVVHQNDRNHNGFNGMLKNVYSYNDYFYDFIGYAGFYSQLKDDGETYPVPLDRIPDHIYFINGRATNAIRGFSFFGGFNCYVYNFQGEKASGNFQYGTDKVFVRKSRFTGAQDGVKEKFRVCDYAPSQYRYIQNATLMDSVFDYAPPLDLRFNPMGDGVMNVINCYRKDAAGTISTPSNSLTWDGAAGNTTNHPEMRFYVWLDVLVKDQNGSLIQDANVTVEGITDPAAPTLEVTLPPPPPDLWEMPAAPLPQPILENFERLKTLSTGKLPGPNYGWSANSEPCAALMMRKLSLDRSSGRILTQATTGYHYQIKATYHGLEASQTVTPDETWLREDPTAPANTVVLVLNGSAAAQIDSVPPTLKITAPLNNQSVFSSTVIQASALDNWDIDRLEIFIDDLSRAVINADACTWSGDAASCAWTWDAVHETAGIHRIKVVAYDISGFSAQQTISVKVRKMGDAVVYPNPYIKGKSADHLCTFANLTVDATVRIYSLNGALIVTLTPETTGEGVCAKWDVGNIGGGIYIYSIMSGQGVQKGKLSIIK